MTPKIILDAAHAGQLADVHTILLVDHLVQHWGQPHVTDDTPCFCGAHEDGGVVVHRRMPWEGPQATRGAA